ncbi:hypothetical protein [Streptomyces sp. NPDC101150]|uniref:hypothetical protein n=1 Tax=Streptomyces sp. NPDC101150 TaxID=3366114 RepID=UPI00381CEDE2
MHELGGQRPVGFQPRLQDGLGTEEDQGLADITHQELVRPKTADHKLIARNTEAEMEGWLGEAEGLRVSLAGAEEKLRRLDRGHGQHAAVDLGIPTARRDR